MANPLIMVFLLTAVATGLDPAYPVGERRALLAYVRGETREGAEAALPKILGQNGWSDWVVEKSGVAGSKQDEGMQLAMRNGASITVYSEPIKSH